jgi:hypothetical protein
VSRTPLKIKTSRVAPPPEMAERTRALLGRRLSRFGPLIESIEVRFKDVNGPRGGIDTACRVNVRVSGRPSVFVEERAVDVGTALSKAAASITQAMDRSVGRVSRTAQAKRRGR